MSSKQKLGQNIDITESQVREYIRTHPDFLHNIPAPKRELGGGVEDFQHYLLKNLQNNSKNLSQRYDMLVDYCRDNLSVQSQVHDAVLKLIQFHDLERLLEFLTIDMLSIFDLDIVRIAIESDSELDTSYGEHNYSGIVFIDSGIADILFGNHKNVLLFGDTEASEPIGFEQIFIDCEDLAASCALLRLDSQMVGKNIILALGVRHKERFHQGQGMELLNFMAKVIASRLDKYLDDLTI
ncbi:MAG: DUF484 family protein [Rickettsiales bacterium]